MLVIQELYTQRRGNMEKEYKDPELQLKRLEVSRTKILFSKQHSVQHNRLQKAWKEWSTRNLYY